MASLSAKILSFVKRKILRLSRDRWNYQYARGQWEGLKQEEDRFQAVIRIMRQLHPHPQILEIGCGDAVLLRKMQPDTFASFTGVDISDVAIAAAKSLERDGTRFRAADMNTYQPDDRFDLIVFNESLYYTKQTVALLQRYEAFLKPGGCFIVTAVQNKYTKDFWPPLEAAYQTGLADEVSNGQHLWHIRQLLPPVLPEGK